MVAILSDDCAPSTEANNNDDRGWNRVDDAVKEPNGATSMVTSPTTVNHGSSASVAVMQSSLPECGYSVVANRDNAANLCKSTVVSCNVMQTASTAAEDGAVPPINGRYACPKCKLICNKPSVLEKHIRTHTNERPYPCLPCGIAFTTRSNLNKHRRSRSHSLKMEEAGDAKFEEEDEDSQMSVSFKDESSNDENKTENLPRTSIYKPKFHKAAIYIQNATTSSKIETNSMNKFGLQLKISPSTTATQNSAPSTPSPFTSGSSPSPEFLHRHISKLISENQAIVETTDPFWSKKFYQRKEGSPSSPLSTSSSSSIDSFKKIPVKQEPQSIEDKLPIESKLAYALLQPRVMKMVENVEDAQPLDLTRSKDTRARSYPDEPEEEENHEMKYPPNGRVVPEYVRDGRYAAKANDPMSVRSKLSIIEPKCRLCDETFDNYDKLKQHVLYQCKGNKNHTLTKPEPVRYSKPPETKLNQSPGPRLGNTPLVGNYKKLSVTTPMTQDKVRSMSVEQKCVTSLKSLEELSNAPMKGNQYVYNAALVPEERHLKDDTKPLMLKTEEQKVIKGSVKPKESFKLNDMNGAKTTSNTHKISQFVIPFVHGVPSLATIQAAPTIVSVTANSITGDVHPLTPVAAYKPTALSVSAVPKPKPNHVNGGVVTIMHGGKVIPYVPGMPGPQSMASAFMHVDPYDKKETVKRKIEDGPNGMIRRMEEAQQPRTIHGVMIKEEAAVGDYCLYREWVERKES